MKCTERGVNKKGSANAMAHLAQYDSDDDFSTETPRSSTVSHTHSNQGGMKFDAYMAVSLDSLHLEITMVPEGGEEIASQHKMLLEKLSEQQMSTFGKLLDEREIDMEDDYFIHCDLCDKFYNPTCRDHPLLWVPDRTVFDPVERALGTVPAMVMIQESKIPNAGKGAFAKTFIPRGVVFGPYQGVVLKKNEKPKVDGYAWEIHNNKGHILLDGSDPKLSNWMRFINMSRHEKEQNVLAFQYLGSIYYRVIKPIIQNKEILVWYGKKYGKSLGVGTHVLSTSRKPPLNGKNPFIL